MNTPNRADVYEVENEDSLKYKTTIFQYWNGEYWGIFSDCYSLAFSYRKHKAENQNVKFIKSAGYQTKKWTP